MDPSDPAGRNILSVARAVKAGSLVRLDGASDDVLVLSGDTPLLTAGVLRELVRSQDVIYVGGGNTLRMMTLWRRRGVDRLLVAAAEAGTVLAGISAGAICWCAAGAPVPFLAVPKIPLVDVKAQYAPLTEELRRRFDEVLEVTTRPAAEARPCPPRSRASTASGRPDR